MAFQEGFQPNGGFIPPQSAGGNGGGAGGGVMFVTETIEERSFPGEDEQGNPITSTETCAVLSVTYEQLKDAIDADVYPILSITYEGEEGTYGTNLVPLASIGFDDLSGYTASFIDDHGNNDRIFNSDSLQGEMICPNPSDDFS